MLLPSLSKPPSSQDTLYNHDNERWNNFHPAPNMNGHSFSITPRQTTAFAGPGGHGAGPSPTLIDWEYANDLFLDDSGARNGSRGNNDAANDAPPGGEPRPGQDDGRTALPVTTSFLKRKMFDAGGGGGSDEKRTRSGGDKKNRGGSVGKEVTLLYPDQRVGDVRSRVRRAEAGGRGRDASRFGIASLGRRP